MKNTRRQAALKAWKTIRARQAFENKYGINALYAIQDIATKDEYYFPKSVYAAYRANLTRNAAYRKMATACRF